MSTTKTFSSLRKSSFLPSFDTETSATSSTNFSALRFSSVNLCRVAPLAGGTRSPTKTEPAAPATANR